MRLPVIVGDLLKTQNKGTISDMCSIL